MSRRTFTVSRKWWDMVNAGSEITPLHQRQFNYWIGDVVFMRVREDRIAGMVTGIFIRPTSECYEVTWSNGSAATYYSCELTREYVPDYVSDNCSNVAEEEE